jgi:prepilin-type N-terminal cleavage/methylation domain-containing protein
MKGFTLIEVTIALTIMAVLTVLSSQSIQQGIKAKAKIQDQIDDMSKVRDSLRVMERDINLAYHYRDIEMEFFAEVSCRSKAATASQPGQAPPPPPPPGATNSSQVSSACLEAFPNDPRIQEKYKNRKDPTTQFIGKSESLDFVSMNAGRISETQVMADFAKIGYSLRSCKKMDGTDAGQCLIRRFSALVEGDVTKGGEETVLVENVTEFKLRYFGKGKQDWNSDWSSQGGDAMTKGNFPQAVEITLSIEVPKESGRTTKTKKISMQLVAPIRFPNNKDKGNSSGGPSGAPGV